MIHKIETRGKVYTFSADLGWPVYSVVVRIPDGRYFIARKMPDYYVTAYAKGAETAQMRARAIDAVPAA